MTVLSTEAAMLSLNVFPTFAAMPDAVYEVAALHLAKARTVLIQVDLPTAAGS